MRTTVQTDYFRVGGQPVIVVRVSRADGTVIFQQASAASAPGATGDNAVESRVASFGGISQEIDPLGGFARVSGASVTGLILSERLPLCTEADLAPTLGRAGRCLYAGSIETYDQVRDAVSAEWGTPAIVCGRNYNAAGGTYTQYRGLFETTAPADMTTCESAWLELAGLGLYLYAGKFRVWLVQGSATGAPVSGSYNDFEDWAAAGDYALVDLAEEWETDEYGAVTRIRLNEAGRQYLVDHAGGQVRFVLVSDRDRDWANYSAGPDGAEFVMWESAGALLRVRYNSLTLDNQVMEIFYGFAPLPETISAATMDLVWTGVVDTWSIDGETISLEGRQNDFKKNRLLPRKIITISEWPDCPEENRGKAVPIVYGEFPLTGEHRAGTANFQGVLPDGTNGNWSYPACIKGYVVSMTPGARTVLFAGHYLKDYLPSFLLFAWNGSTRAFEPLPCAATQVSDSHGHYRVLTPVWSDLVPNAFCEGKFRAVGALLPNANDHLGVTTPENAYDASEDTYAELGQGDYIDFYFANPMGGADNGIMSFTLWAEFSGGADPAGLHVKTYKDERDTVSDTPNWVEQSDDTPWTGDNQVNLNLLVVDDSTGYHRQAIQLGQYKIRIEKADALGTAKITDVCAMVSRDVSEETEFYTHGKGKRDSALGTVTGSGYALIENPSHVVESLERDELGLAAAEIDTAAFDAAATEQAGMKLSFQLLEREDSYDTIDDIGRQSRQIFWWDERDRLTVRVAGTDAAFPNAATGLPNLPGNHDIFTRTGSPVNGVYTYHPLFGGVVRKPVDISRVKNDFVARYGLNLASGEYAGVIICDKDGCTAEDADLDGVTAAELADLCAESYARIGTVNTRELDLWAVYDRATAARTLQHYVQWETRRREEAELVTGHSALQIEPGDLINIREERVEEGFGDGDMNVKKWMVVEISPELNTGRWGVKAIEM